MNPAIVSMLTAVLLGGTLARHGGTEPKTQVAANGNAITVGVSTSRTEVSYRGGNSWGGGKGNGGKGQSKGPRIQSAPPEPKTACVPMQLGGGGWETGTVTCFTIPNQPTASQPGQPSPVQQGPTLADILTAAQTAIGEMTITPPTATVQPGTNALIHVPTNFYCDPAPTTLGVTVLGIPITAVVTPQTFTWDTGDGQVGPTSDPGHPYPQMTVTHTYQRTGTYRITLQTTYSAVVTIPGQGTFPLPDSMLTTREVTTLTVRQAPVQHIDSTP